MRSFKKIIGTLEIISQGNEIQETENQQKVHQISN